MFRVWFLSPFSGLGEVLSPKAMALITERASEELVKTPVAEPPSHSHSGRISLESAF